MPTTLKDIASAAGVSWQVVAGVLRGNGTARASAETAQRVRRLAEEMDYRPHAAARSLVTGQSRNIEVHEYTYDVANDQISSTHLPVVSAFSLYCQQKRYNLLLVAGANLQFEDRIRGLREQNVDAMVHLAVTDFSVLEAARQGGVLSLCVSPILHPSELSAAGYPVINFDNGSGMRQILDYLLKLGHREIGFVRGKSGHSDFEERWNVYRGVMNEQGLPIRDEWVWEDFPYLAGGDAVGVKVLNASRRPTAIVCSNDAQAFGLIRTLQAGGMSVPHDISVTGYDDGEAASLITPALTTIRQDWSALSWSAAKQLFTLLREKDVLATMPLEQRFPVQFIERESCSAPNRGQCRETSERLGLEKALDKV